MSTNRLSGRARPILLQSPPSIRGEPEYIIGSHNTQEIRIVYIDQEAQKAREKKQTEEFAMSIIYIIASVFIFIFFEVLH